MKNVEKVYHEGWGWGIHFVNKNASTCFVQDPEELKYFLDTNTIDNLDYIEALDLLKGINK